MSRGRAGWLIDGNNVMGSRPDGWWRDRRGAARALAAELAEFAAREDVPVTVVFDGAPFDVEAPVQDTFTLGAFLDIWSVTPDTIVFQGGPTVHVDKALLHTIETRQPSVVAVNGQP